jgi:sarcosine oxidase subunit beta
MREKADIAVIGGGLIGSAISYFLSQRVVAKAALARRRQARDLVLVEAEDLGAGASGACDGLTFTQTKLPGPHLELALKSLALYEELETRFGEEIELERSGGLVVAETQAEWEALKETGQNLRSSGANVEILNGEELRDLEPALSPNLIGASFSPIDGQVNPLVLNFALAQAAKENGVEVRLFWKVRSLEKNKRKAGYCLKGEKGEIEAEKVVVAAGIQTPLLLKSFGLDLPIIPRRGQILVTETAPRILSRPLISASYLRAKFATPAFPSREDEEKVDCGLSIEQTKAGNFLIGSTREFVGLDKGASWEAMKLLASRAEKALPYLKELSVIRAFAGLRPYTPDGLPVLGEVPGHPGLYVASGHEGDGVMLAPITGKLMAELLLEGKTSFDLAPFAASRFQEKQKESRPSR